MIEKYWKKRAKVWKERMFKWKKKFQDMESLRNSWKFKSGVWKEKYQDCNEDLEGCVGNLEKCEEEPDPQPNKAIKSLSIKNGKFIVNGKETTLIGVGKREMICASVGAVPNLSYNPEQVKQAILVSNTNYIRVIAPKNLAFFRREIIDYLEAGKVVEVELFDAGKPYREYQAYWKDTFDVVKDLPVFFDAMNEFMDNNQLAMVNQIVNWVANHGGLVCAGAWGASNYGEKSAKEFKALNNKYQIVSHHQRWTQSSIDNDREPGKPVIASELHTRDITLNQMKKLIVDCFDWGCQGVQVYPLANFDENNGAKFQKILDYAGSLVK